MAVRFRKYLPQCKPIRCNGRKGRYCPDRPRRANGEYRVCGVWAVEFFDENKKWQSLTYKDVKCKADAERRLSLFIADRERGMLNLPKKRNVPVFHQYTKQYLGLCVNDGENTRASKSSVINMLTKRLGNYRLDKITPFIIKKFRVERQAADGVKNSTINANVEVLNCLLNQAMQDGLITENPCRQVNKLKVSQTKTRILSDEEISILFNRLKGKDRLMTTIGLFHGLRLNEVLRLKWGDFNLEKKLLSFVPSKTGKLITNPISNHIVKELNDYKTFCTTGHLFVELATRSVVLGHSKYFSETFKQLGLQGVTFHTLRHTFCSLLQADLGVGPVIAQHLLGHSDLSITTRYSHAGLDNKRQAIELLSRHIVSMGQDWATGLSGKTRYGESTT